MVRPRWDAAHTMAHTQQLNSLQAPNTKHSTSTCTCTCLVQTRLGIPNCFLTRRSWRLNPRPGPRMHPADPLAGTAHRTFTVTVIQSSRTKRSSLSHSVLLQNLSPEAVIRRRSPQSGQTVCCSVVSTMCSKPFSASSTVSAGGEEGDGVEAACFQLSA